MKSKAHFLTLVITLILTGLFLVPALGQDKMRWATLVKELKLSPDKAKDFTAVEAKYAKDRQALTERLKKSHTELQNALAAATPDDAKIKGLVAAIRADQAKMTNSFKFQQDEELTLMTPVQQGQYLMFKYKWREEMKQEYKKMKKK